MVTVKARLTREAHTSRPWRIHQIAPDFDVLDVWALPTPGGPDDFPRLLDVMSSIDAERSSPVVHALFAVRWALGRLFGWDDSSRGEFTPGFTSMYAADDETALQIANATMRGVLHLGWVPDGAGGYRGQMTVLVKPNGLLGGAYLAAIAPFRRLIVYPTMLRAIGRAWGGHVPPVATVRQVEPPPDLRRLGTLPRVDYEDAFIVRNVGADWTAERWARAMLEEAPAVLRATLLSGWAALGLKSAGSVGQILGWEVRRRSPDTLLLGRESRIGMPGELLVTRHPEGLLFATFVHHRTPLTRLMWSAVRPTHVRTVRMLLERAARNAVPAGVRESAGAG